MKEETRSDYQERITRVLLYIRHHLDDPLSLDELASVAYFSPYHFHRVFRGMVGETVAEHVRRLRLERAARHLIYTPRSVTDLAFDAGYETMESFIRAFRKRFGYAPSCYRQIKSAKCGRCADDAAQSFITQDFTFEKGELAMNDANIVKLESRKVAFIRHTGPYNECGAAWEKLCAWAGEKGLFGPNTQFLGLSYDDPEVTPPEKIRYDACLTIDTDVRPEGEVGVQEIPGGRYAVTLHQGPLEKLADTYATLCGQWMPSSGGEMKDSPSVEVYLNDPEKTPPEEIKVEIQMPLV